MVRPVLTFCDEDLRITDLVTPDDPALVDVTFERCRVIGPALLQLVQGRLTGNDYGAGDDPDTVLWTVSPWAGPVRGSVIARRCTFTDCVFEGVAFVGPAALMNRFRTVILARERTRELAIAGSAPTESTRVPAYRAR